MHCISLRALAILPPLLCAAVAGIACESTTITTDSGIRDRYLTFIEPFGADIGLMPGDQTTLRVKYAWGASQAISDAEVQFAIFGDPRGSTLSSDTTRTDMSGIASIQVRAGAVSSSFQVHVSADQAQDLVFYIEVSNAGFGTLSIRSLYVGALPIAKLEKIIFSLYGEVSCSSIDYLNLQPPLRERIGNRLSDPVSFKALPLNLSHTLVARAWISESTGNPPITRLQAAGCVEIPVGTLNSQQEMILSLMLFDLQPQLAERYLLSSGLTLSASTRSLAQALGPWADLVDCELDPAQLLLDCILDALDPADPLDCRVDGPSPTTQALLAERGILSGTCRSTMTAKNTASIDQQIHALIKASGESLLAKLKQVEASGAQALRQLGLQSTLVILGKMAEGKFLAAHQLESISFLSKQSQLTFPVSQLGLFQWLAAPIPAAVSPAPEGAAGWRLSLGEHAFSFPYGLLAQKALADLVLVPASLPASSSLLAAKLADLVISTSGTSKLAGCPAIEAILCKAARLESGCLGEACRKGSSALAAYLDSGFTELDAVHPTLTLDGQTMIEITNNTLRAEKLGDEANPGIWNAKLMLSSETIIPQSATFTGMLR